MLYEGQTYVQECLHMVKWGCKWWLVSRHEPLDTTPYREIIAVCSEIYTNI